MQQRHSIQYKSDTDPVHESALRHITGEAVYINDIPVNDQMLHGFILTSTIACGKIISMDVEKAKMLDGVHAILSYKDIPGINQMGPVADDELCLAEKDVDFIGKAILLIAAETTEIALKASRLIDIEYERSEPVLVLEDAIRKGLLIIPPIEISTGDADKALSTSKHTLKGELRTGAQEHWYLETQTCLAIPGEDDEMGIFSSTQHPSETQAIISRILKIPKNNISVEVRRIGGAFGGKETQANHFAAWAALLAHHTKKPVKIHMNRIDDQKITGKRHRSINNYEVGFSDDGTLTALKVAINLDAGSSTDLSRAILQRAVFHIDNCYFIPNLKVNGQAWKTNHPSNTAFRGFGAPQAMAVIEQIIDKVARYLSKDPLEVRFQNFYRLSTNNITHYGQIIENNRLIVLYEQLVKSSAYVERRKSINEFNKAGLHYKKGLALTPVKFGVSFTASFLNQAGALVNIYTDGTVLVSHGGIEMGQGLHTKIMQVAASELGIGREYIKVDPTNTSKVPNTSATAASSGSDLNGMAVKNAVEKLKKRLAEVFVNEYNEKKSGELSVIEDIRFSGNFVSDNEHPERKISFEKLVKKSYKKRVSLSATGFYKTPGIYYDRTSSKGNPFHYYAFGMAVSEVLLDTLTGQFSILRTDILHDAGNSINKNIDKGQLSGGFIQGVGWCTTEEIKWDENGHLLNHSPDTYKIPTIRDIPEDFRISFLQNVPNPNTIKKSKAIGEPPFMLSFSVWLAIKDAISAVGDHRFEPEFSLPATKELILKSIEDIRKKMTA